MTRKMMCVFLFGLTLFVSGCLPSSEFNVALRLEDAATGKPIPAAWVVTVADIEYSPLREAPYDKAVAAARGITNASGVAKFKKVEGVYFGQEPTDQLWQMLESRKPKVTRKITGVRGGSIFIFAKDYGFIHQPFTVANSDGKYAGWLDFGDYELNLRPIKLASGASASGEVVTVKVRRPAHPETAGKAFQTQMLAMLMSGMSKHTGATLKEKEALYNFFVRNMEEAARTNKDPFFQREYEELADPETRKTVMNWSPAQQTENHDTALHEWLTEKALENLPEEYEEVKLYAEAIRRGIKDEDTGLRSVHHFYNPETGTGLSNYADALRWGAIGYPNNADNEWDLEDAVAYYRKGDKENAYKALGHVLHLLEDMSSPMHTRGIIHPFGAERSFEKYFGGLLKANNNDLPMEYRRTGEALKTKEIKQQFEDLAKLTFASFTKDGQAINFNEYYQQGKLKATPDNETLQAMGRALFPGTIAQVERLAKNFYMQANPERYAQAKQNSVVTDAGDGNPQSKRGHIERLFDKDHEVVRFIDKDGKKTKEINLRAKETKIKIGKTDLLDQKKIGISPKVLAEIEEIRKSHGRDIVFSRQESREARFSQNEKFLIVEDLYLDFVEFADARDSELSGDPVETGGQVSIYGIDGNKIFEISKNEGMRPIVSNTGQYIVMLSNEEKKNKIYNTNKKILAEFDGPTGPLFFSQNDRYILLVHFSPDDGTGMTTLSVYDTTRNKLEIKKIALPWSTFSSNETPDIQENTRTMIIRHEWDPAQEAARTDRIRF